MNSINSGRICTSAEGCTRPFNEQRVVKYIRVMCPIALQEGRTDACQPLTSGDTYAE